MRPYKKQAQGAILLEALVAVVILTVGLTFVLQAMMQHLRAARVAQEYSLAAQQLDNSLTPQILVSLNTNKKPSYICAVSDDKFHCEVKTASALASPDKDINFQPVSFNLSWPSGKGDRSLNIPYYTARVQE